jgi:hypothetical protein
MMCPSFSKFSDDTTKVGVCGRVTSTTAANSLSGYCIFLRTDGTGTTGKLQVSKKVSSGSMASMDTSTAAVPLFAKDTWYKVKLKVVGTSPVTVTGCDVAANGTSGSLLRTITSSTAPCPRYKSAYRS